MCLGNLTMATGMVGREGVGVNPLRGQGNVQGGSCLGSWPHMLTGYRFVTDDAVRGSFEDEWKITLDSEPGLRLPNMFDAAVTGSFKAIYIQGEDPVQSDPNRHHVEAALRSMECVVVQDLYLSETAKLAHVFFPGSSSLEKDGTFTNAERRVSMVRKVVEPLGGLADWQITVGFMNAMGYECHYDHPSEVLDEIARTSPAYSGMSFDKIEKLGSVQWPCNTDAPEGTEVLHTVAFPRGKGSFMLTGYLPTQERATDQYPLLLTTGRILSQYNVGTQTRRTANVVWHDDDLLEISADDAAARGLANGDRARISSRYGATELTVQISERVNPGIVYTTSPATSTTGPPTAPSTRSPPSTSSGCRRRSRWRARELHRDRTVGHDGQPDRRLLRALPAGASCGGCAQPSSQLLGPADASGPVRPHRRHRRRRPAAARARGGRHPACGGGRQEGLRRPTPALTGELQPRLGGQAVARPGNR